MHFQVWLALAAGTPEQAQQAAAIAMEQSAANKAQPRAAESEKYQQWLTQGQAKGMRPLSSGLSALRRRWLSDPTPRFRPARAS